MPCVLFDPALTIEALGDAASVGLGRDADAYLDMEEHLRFDRNTLALRSAFARMPTRVTEDHGPCRAVAASRRREVRWSLDAPCEAPLYGW